MTKRLRLILFLTGALSCFQSFAQVGTEFWLAPPEATSGHVTDEPILLRIASGNAAATVTISMPAEPTFNGGADIVINVPANSSSTVDLSADKDLLETKPMDQVLTSGLKITSDVSITVYYEINTNNNPDIWALKGPNSLGTEFYIPMQQQWRNGNYSPDPYSSFDIVATQDNTTVLIFPSKDLEGPHPAFTSYSVTLNEGETYSGGVYSTNGADNPAGSILVSDKPIAVSIKDDSVWPEPAGCKDMNGDQLVPVNIVGKEYIVVKGGLTINEYAYVTATANNTELYIDGVLVANLFNGENYEILIDSPTKFIETSKPSYLIHMSGFGCETGTALLPPLNCAGSEQVFFTRSTTEQFILTILVPTGAEDAFELNGDPNLVEATDFNVVPGTGGVWQFAYITFSTGQIPINTAQLLTNSEEVFSLGIINGGASSGCRYGYFSEFASEIIVDAGPNDIVCANDTVQLAGSVEGGATAGIWTSSGTGTFIPDASALNAQYLYSIDDVANGQVTLTLTSVSNCFPVEDEMTVTIPPAPIVAAGADMSVCRNNSDVNLNGAVTFASGGQWSGGSGTFTPNDITLNAVYTPTQVEIDSGSLTLTLTSIGNGTCHPESDELNITFTDAPEANAGPNQTYCANNANVVLNGSVTGASGGTWSGGGGAWDPSPNALNVTYFPTSAELATGSVSLTLTTTGNGNCLPETDVVLITFTPAPDVNAGFNEFVCGNNADVVLDGSVTVATGGQWSGGLGTFTPNSATLNATYSPAATEIANGQVTLTLTSTGNGSCVSETDEMTIFIGPSPVANAGANQTVCANNASVSLSGTVANAGGGQWSGGAGSFVPSSTDLNATYTPTAAEATAGSVTLTLTTTGNGNCSPVSDEMTITITPAPVVNAGSDQTLCANNAQATLNGSVTVASGGTWSGGNGSFLPNINALDAVYTPTATEINSGSVSLTLTSTGNGNCVAENDVVQLSFTPSPTANAGTDISVCSNNADVSLGGSVTVATGGVWSGGNGTFNPSSIDLNAVYTPTQTEINSGNLTLTLTTTGNGNCTAVTDEVDIAFTPAPTADAGANFSVCSNNSDITLNGAVTIASGGTWSGGAGSFNPDANTLNAIYTPTPGEVSSGSVTLTLTTTGNDDCLAESDEITVSFTPAPTASAGLDQEVCDNTPDVILNGAVTIATGGTWSGGTGSFNPDANTLNATYTPSATEITAGSVTLTLTTSGNGNCIAESDTMTITITEGPQVDAGMDANVCSNNTDISLSGSVQFATGGQWTGGLGLFSPNASDLNATYTPTAGEVASGSITLTLTSTGNGSCQASSDEVTYTFTPAPTADAGNDRIVCANDPDVTLEGAVTVASGGTWSGGTGIFNPDVNTLNAEYTPSAAEILNGAVTLTLTTTGNGNCNAVSNEMTIIITQAPTANAGADETVCANNLDVELNGSVTIANGGVWSGGTGTFTPDATDLEATYTPSAAEITAGGVTLTLTTTGNGLCQAVEDEMSITITPAPEVDAGSDQVICSNNADITLSGSVTIATGGQWTGGLGSFSPNSTDLNAVYTPTQSEINSGSLTLTLTSTGNGLCVPESDQLTITFTPTPTADAGANQTVCANDPDVTLAGVVTIATGGTWSGGTGSFSTDENDLNAIYTPSAAEISAGTVQLTLTTTGNGNCIAVTDVITITITPAPVVNAGLDETVCANDAAVDLDGAISVAIGGLWTGGTGTFFPDNTDLEATYTPSPAEITAGVVNLTLTSTGNGNCIAVADEMQINITPSPVVDAGSDQTLCNNNADAQLNGSVTVASGGQWTGGLGTFTPSSTALDAEYTPSSAELINGSVTLTLTSTGNGNCVAVTDQMTITFTDAPTVDAGTDLSSCANNPTVTLNGFVSAEATGGQWSGGAGTFNPNNFSLNANYTPTAIEIANGGVTLTLTSVGNGNCIAVSDEVFIDIAPSPVADAGSNQTVCSNNSLVTLNGNVTNATGGIWSGGNGTYNPSATALNATYDPTPAELSAGSVSLTLTTTGIGNCNPDSDVMNINFTLSPTANAGANQAACENNSTVTLNGAVTVATGGSWTGGLGSFSPNNTTLNATYTPTQGEIAGGSVTLTLTTTGNGNCLAVTDQMTITYSAAPTVDAGSNQTVCSNNAEVTLDGEVFGATGGIWSGGTGSFSPNAFNLNASYTPTAGEIASGSLTLTLTSAGNGNCNAEEDEVTITFSPSPVVNAGADANICSNNANIPLGGSVTVASGGEWSGGAGSFTPDNTVLNATYTPTAGELANGTVTLTLTSTGNGSCQAESDQVTYTFTPAPTVDAGSNQSICSNNPDVTLSGSITVASGAQWSGGLGSFSPSSTDLNAVYTPTQSEINSGSLTLTLTSTGNGNCTPVSDFTTITFTSSPTANAGSNINVCANNPEATLNGSVVVATGGTWSGGNGSFDPDANTLNATYTPSAAEITNGSITLTLTTTGNGNCIPDTDEVTINIAPAPVVNAGTDHIVCANSVDVELDGSVANAAGGIWTGGDGSFDPSNTSLGAVYTPSAAEIATGSVQLTLTSTGNGTCLAENDVVDITITPAPVVDAGSDQTLCQNNSTAQLNASISVASGGQWSGGSGSFSPSSTNLNATYTPNTSELVSGSVTLTLTSTGNGNCMAVTDEITLTYTPAPTANAGSNFSVCSNNADFQLNGSVTVAAGGEWSGGNGTFSPNNFTLNADYSPTSAEIASGSLTLTLTTSGSGNCTEVTDEVTITFDPSPVANAGADLISCENNPAVTLLGSVSNAGGGIWTGGNGTFDPSNTAVGADYSPTAAEILSGSVTLTLTTTDVDDCNPVSDQMTITFTPSPEVEAGPDQFICSNNTTTVLAGSVDNAAGGSWSGGAGSFSPSTSALNATYSPSATEVANGSVTLTLTSTGNGTCLPESDVMTIVFTASPTADAGPNQTVCSNNPNTDLAGSVTIASGGTWTGGNGLFNPDSNTLGATYTPTATEISSGQVTLTLTTTGNGNCIAVSDQMTISFSPSPNVNAGSNITVCANNAEANLNGSVTIATGGVWSGGNGSFDPANTSLGANYTATAAEIANGSVTLTLTSTGNGTCNPESDTVTINFSPAPTADAGADQAVCANNTDTQLNGSVTIATGGSWSGGNGTFTPGSNVLNPVYTPSQSEVNAGSVTLTLTTTGNANCSSESDTMTITFDPAPTVDAGSNMEVCSNNALVSLNGAVTIATGGTWSGGAGTFNPSANALNATYQPTAGEIAAGTITLTLTSTGNGDCNEVEDEVLINFTPSPTANAGVNQNICENNPDISLNGSVTIATGGTWSGGAGTFTPDANALNAAYTPTAGEITAGNLTLTLTTTGNGDCNPVSDQMTVTFTPSPTANAGSDQTVCENNPTATLNGSVTVATGGTWSGGLGGFSPSSNQLNAQYTPTQGEINNGSVTLTLTTTGNGNCAAVTDVVTIDFSPAPTVNAGSNQSVCENNADVTLNGSVTISSGGTWSGGDGTFNPDANTLNAIYTPTQGEIDSGNVTLTLTTTGNGNCLAVTDDMVVTFTPAPTVNAGPNKTTCANNASVSISATVIGATGVTWSGGNGTFDPDANSVNVIYFPSAAEIAAGTVTLTATTTGNGNCLPVTDNMTITITPAVVADAGSDQTLCANNADIELDGSVVIASGGVWSGGLGSFTPNASTLNATYTPTAGEISSGNLTLTLTTTGNGQCNAASDTVNFTFTPSPIVDAGLNATVCANDPEVDLSGSVTVASGGIWSGGAGSFSPSNTSLTATYTPSAAEISAGSVQLTLTSTGNGNCIAVEDVMIITITPAPVVNAGANQTVCANNPDVDLNGSVTVASGGTWTGGNGSFSPDENTLGAVYTPSTGEIATGSVSLTLTSTGNGNCVAVTDVMNITITPAPTAEAGPDQEVCSNNPAISLSGSVTNATGGAWSGGLGSFAPNSSNLNAVYTPTQTEINSGSITLTLTTTGIGNCIAVTDSVTISFGPTPTADAGPNQSVCANNEAVQLNGSVTIATGGTWTGGTGSFTPDANALNAVYNPSQTEIDNGSVILTLTTTGNGNCNAVVDQMTINITPAPVVNAGSDKTVCANNPDVQLNGSVTVVTGGVWSGGNGTFSPDANTLNAVYTPTQDEIEDGGLTLTLTSTGNGNCDAESDVMNIIVTPAPIAEAGTNQEVCSNNPAIGLNGAVTNANGGSWSGGSGTFAPNSNTLNATYNPTPSEISSGEITLTLTTTGIGNCLAVTDTVTVAFGPSPTANAGTNQTVCANNADVNLNGAVTIATGGTWTGGNGSFSPDENTLNAIYTPTAAEIDSGGVTLTLTTTGNGDCLPVTDEMNIVITPAPVVNAGSDQIICANNAGANLNGSVSIATGGTWTGGNGTFSPDENALNAIYTPTAIEIANGSVNLTLTSTGNGNCVSESDVMNITITPAPIVEAGPDQEVCSNNANVDLDGSVTVASGGGWSGGLGSFSPNSNTLNATYSPTQTEINAGSIILTLTSTGNGNCVAVSDSLTITFGPSPTADAGTNQTVCANNADVLLNGGVTVATGGTWTGGNGAFDPNENTLNAIYTPTQSEIDAGNLTLTLTTTGNGNCSAVSDEMNITITPAPVVNAGSNQTVCANNSEVDLNGNITIASGGIWSGGNGTFTPDATALGATYTPSAGEILAGSVSLTLTSTGNGNCIAEADVMNITITPAPTAEAGPDQEVCSNNPAITLAGSVTNATGGAWSGGLGSFTPNSNNLSAVYTPTQSEINSGSIILTLTTTGIGNCIAVTDSLTITFSPSPTADAGSNQTVCANNEAVQLNGAVTIATGGTWSGGNGTFTPDANTLNAVYNPAQSEIDAGTVTLTLTTTGNGDCNPENDEMTITITPAPVVNAGSNQTVCANNPDVQLNGSVTVVTGGAWSGGNGTFSPDANTLNAVYTPTAAEITAGSVDLTLTSTGNGNCQAVTDVMIISITPAPTADAGLDQEVCSNNSDISLSGSVTSATGGTWSGGLGSFTPNANSLNTTYSPAQVEINAGSVTLYLTTTGIGNCIAVTDSLTITFSPSPTADAGTNQTVCANNAEIALNGAVTVATGGIWSGGNGTFAPNANTLNVIYTPTQTEIDSGGVTLTLTTTGNGDCLAVSDSLEITITPAPVVNAGSNQTVCANNADVTLNGSVTIASGGTWSGGNGSFEPDANTLGAIYTPTTAEIAVGSVSLTLTSTGNGNCLPESDVMNITITPAPTVEAGPDQEVCSNNPAIDLDGSVTVATGGSWSGGLGSFSPNSNTLDATYTPTQTEINAGSVTLTLTTTGIGNCTPETDSLTITFTPTPTVNAGVNQTVCANNEDVQLDGSVTVATGGTWTGGNGTFVPNANTLDAIYTPSADEITAGNVTLTLTTTDNGDCLAETDEMTINITPAPVVNAGPDQFSCANDTEVTITGTVTVASGGSWTGGTGSYDPTPNSLSITYTPSAAEIAAGSVTLTLTSTGNGLCNPVSDEVVITIDPSPIVDAGEPQIVCANNNQVQLDGDVQLAGGAAWSGGNGTFDPNPNTLDAIYIPSSGEIANGTVSLTLTSTGNGNCLQESDIVDITITPAPTVDAGESTTVCADEAEIELDGTVTVATGGVWSGGNGTFDPSDSDLNAIYTPTFAEISSGSITLTLTTTGNGDCLEVSDEVTIDIQPVPFVNAGPDITVCANNSDVQLGGIFFNAESAVWSGGLGTFTPNNTDINAVYIPSQAEIITGELTLTLTTVGTAFCEPREDEVDITITPAPIVDAGLDVVSCANNPDGQLDGSVENAGGGIWSGGNGSFLPNAGALNAVYVATAEEIESGSVILTLTSTGNGSCLPETDEVEVFYTDAPVVDAGSDITVCENNLEAQLNGSVVGASGGFWSGGSGSFNPGNNDLNAVYTPSQEEIDAGSVQLTLTSTGNGDCLPESDVVTITIAPAPEVFAGNDVLTCVTDLEIQLNGEVVGATNTGEWSTNGTGFFVPSPTDLNATYHLSSADSAQGIIEIILSSTNNGTCIGATDTLSITVLPPGIALAGEDVTVCANNAAVFLDGDIDGEATDGSWSTDGDGIFTPNSDALNATYLPGDNDIANGGATLTLTANSCDAAQDELVVTITPAPVVDAGNDITICVDNLEASLNGSVSGGATTGIWSTSGSGTFEPDNTALDATYIASSADSANQVVILTLTATNFGNCNVVSDQLELEIYPEGTANAGSDIVICENQTEVPLNGVISGAADQGVWSSTGSGTFVPNPFALDASYVPSQEDIDNGMVNLILTTTNSCNFSSDFLNLTINPGPSADAGSDIAVCEAIFEFDLSGLVENAGGGVWSTSGTGTFDDPNDLNTTYFATEDDLENGIVTITLTTTENGICEPATDQLTIIVTEGIVADAGEDQVVCEQATETDLQGVVSNGSTTGEWSTDGTGTFVPDIDDLNATYVFSSDDIANGSVLITLTSTNNGVCEPAVDVMEITFGPAPFVSAGDDLEVCADVPEADLSGFITGGASEGIWSTSGTGTFEPNNTALDATYIASQEDADQGSVELTLTTTDQGLCDANSDSVTLTILPAPVVNAGDDMVVCDSNEQIVLNGSVQNAGGGYWTTSGTGTFLPDSTALNVLYIPSEADSLSGTVTITLTSTENGLCQPVTDEMNIQLGVELLADAGEDTVVCANEPMVVLNGSVGGSASEGIWTTSGDGTFDPDPTDLDASYIPGADDLDDGSVELTLSTTDNSGCPAATDVITITFEPVAVIEAGANLDLCGPITDIDLSPTTENAVAIVWSTSGSGTFNPDPFTEDATYTPSAADSTAGSVTLTISSNNEGVCDEVEDNLTITFYPEPTAAAGADFVQCNTDLEIQLEGLVTGADSLVWTTTGTGTFVPNANDPNAVYVASPIDSISGSVTLTLSTITGSPCDDTEDSITITFEASPILSAGEDIVTCGSNNNVTPEATVQNSNGIVWTTSGTGSFIPDNTVINASYELSETDIENGGVILTVTAQGGEVCPDVTDQLEVIISNPLVANFDVVNPCVGQTTQFVDQTLVISGSIASWQWDFGNGSLSNEQNPSLVYAETGSYSVTLTVTDANGCSDETTMLVEISEVPVAGFSVTEVDEEGTFSFSDESFGADTWEWTFGDGVGSSNAQDPAYQYNLDGLYTVTQYVTNEFGCIDSALAVVDYEGVRVLPPKLPNAFSPNGDGENDVYFVLGGPFSQMDFRVYNGWGELIFQSERQEDGWDGTFRGQDVEVGVYVYTINAVTIEGEPHEKSGQITLIR